jgi:hypothetical protein
VRYVDYVTREENLRKFPELDPRTLVTPDIVDDGFVLANVPAESQQFVAANHVLEHASNPGMLCAPQRGGCACST